MRHKFFLFLHAKQIKKMNSQKLVFSEWESDFYRFLSSPMGNVNKHSRTNYMSWLKFLSMYYTISSELTENDIDIIIETERIKQIDRDIYSTHRDLTNFRSALRKFIQFIQSDYTQKQDESIENELNLINNDSSIKETERDALFKARIGQGLFRKRLIEYWQGCSITNFGLFDILVASHIKPWRDSSNVERLSTYNGLLLLPNYDKLFDKGYISFNKKGFIIFSRFFPEIERAKLGVDESIHLTRIESQHIEFLEYHYEYCFMH